MLYHFFTAPDNTRSDEAEEEVEVERLETWQALCEQEEKERHERRRKEEQEGKAKGNSTKAHEKKDDKECLRICYPYQMEEGGDESVHDTHTYLYTPYIIHINSVCTEYTSEYLDGICIMSEYWS